MCCTAGTYLLPLATITCGCTVGKANSSSASYKPAEALDPTCLRKQIDQLELALTRADAWIDRRKGYIGNPYLSNCISERITVLEK
jgi:hypothetical protein